MATEVATPGRLKSALPAFGLTREAFVAHARAVLPSGSGVAPDLHRWLFREGRLAFDLLGDHIPEAQQALWRAAFACDLLEPRRVIEEPLDLGTTAKAIFSTVDGYEVETVLIPMRYHPDGSVAAYSQCLSSQVGCRMGCTFCETGRMGLIRNLTAAEIVAQVMTARVRLGWQAKNLVFMGMGEALDNWDELHQALLVLTDRAGLGYGQDRITVCTSGHADGLRKLQALGWKRLNLSISLNSAEDRARSRMMPVNRSTGLADLQTLLGEYRQRRNFVLGVNYCLIPGLNDSREDASRIAAFCAPLGRCLLNLIPYNPGSAPIARAPSEEEIVQFVGWLRCDGISVRRRITKGRSIMAACGQLGNVELRRKKITPAERPG
ncbi:MAG TPA: 23S rRNA (adenine(2503)-C2)-methyltransferase [Planctomycetes bacterium]|nr:23S rRNA (adenine(2503)-C2)-methyltransferase [Planctomycetota bacterium]